MASTTFYNSQNLAGIGSIGIGTTSPTSPLQVIGSANVSANVTVGGNLIATNVLSLTGTTTVASNLLVLGNIIGLSTLNVVSANVTNNMTIVGNLFTANMFSSNSASGNIYISANLIVLGNIYGIGGAVGSGAATAAGASQGTVLTLTTNRSLGTAFTTGLAGPGISGFNIDLRQFTAQAIQAVTVFSTSTGMIKFSSAGLYQIQVVLASDQPASKIAVGTATTSTFPPGSSGTSGYVYVSNLPSGSSPSSVVTIPLTVTDITKYYYLDAYFQTGASLLYQTAPPSGSTVGTNYGTYIQIAPFGNYVSSGSGVGAGLLTTLSSASNLSSVYSSNAYRISMTTANNWTVGGSSTAMSVTANGNFQFNQTGVYELSLCVNTSGATPVQFQVGTLTSDAVFPPSSQPYLYTYAPMYTQDPTTAISMPVNITNISNVYFIECSFQGTQTGNVVLNQQSTFVMCRPVGSYFTNSTNPWISAGSTVYYSGGKVALNAGPGGLTESFTVSGNTSFIGNVTTVTDASGSGYVTGLRVPAGSLGVQSYVTGSVPLTTTTSLINNYLSNAAAITANTGTGTITQALYLPGTANSCVNFQNAGSSVALVPTNTTNVFIEAWINPGSFASNPIIVASGTSSQMWNFYITNSGYLEFNAAGGGGTLASSSPLNIGTWYHVAVSLTPNLTTKANIWVNGTQTTYSQYSTGIPTTLASSNIYIGQNYTSGQFSGNVADVRIWSGGIVPTTATRPSGFTAANAPFGTAQPSYITGTPTLQLSLQTQYFPGASTSPYGPVLTLPGTVGSYYSESIGTNPDWKAVGFTLEAWVNYASFANSNTLTASATQPFSIGTMNPASSTGNNWSFGATSTGSLGFGWTTSSGSFSANSFVSTNTLTTGSWNHVLVQSNGSNVYMAINGTFSSLTAQGFTPTNGAGSIAPSIAPSTSNTVVLSYPVTVGQFNNAQGPNFAVAKARLVYGANLYSTGNFTPSPNFIASASPTTWQLDSQYPLPTFPTLLDTPLLPSQSSSYGAQPVVVGGVSQSSLSPYASGQLQSLNFNGTGYIDYGASATSSLTTNIWASNWTIEGWVYLNSYTNTNIAIREPAAGGISDWTFGINTAGVPYVNSNTYLITSSTALPLATWSHVALTYDGTRSNIYSSIQTTPSSGVPYSSNLVFTPTQSLRIGGGVTYPSINGNLADVRVSNVARYTGSTYTVPSAPFVTDSNTLLLLKSLGQQTGQTLEIQGRGLNATSIGAGRTTNAYPPAPMSSYLLDTTGNVAVTYGQGKYVASASTETSGAAWNIFDKNTGTFWFGGGSYTGPYNGTVTTVDGAGNSYAGEWIQIQMSVSIITSSYSVNATSANNYTPKTWYILGSRDGLNWTFVHQVVGQGTNYNTTFPVSATQSYNFFRMVINATNGNNPAFVEWILNGTEEGLCITADSKVGVGIANPQRSLEVAGDLVVGGTISGGYGMGQFRNRIINGDMRIAQRGTTNVVPNSSAQISTYLIDRFQTFSNVSTGILTQSQASLASSDAPYQLGLKNYSNIFVTSGFTSSNIVSYAQIIEGYNISDLSWGTSFGVPVTVSFWFRNNAPSGSFFNLTIGISGSQTQYITSFTSSPTIWQYLTFSIPPPANGTTVNSTSSGGIIVHIAPYGVIQTGPGWNTTGSAYNTQGSYNWPSLAGNYIHLTGVQLEKGTVATPFEFRPYGTELALCQRYYQEMPNTNGAHFTGVGRLITTTNATNGAIIAALNYTTTMRAAPTPTYYGGGSTSGTYNVFTSSSGSQVNTLVSASSTSTASGGNMIVVNIPAITTSGGSSQWVDMSFSGNGFGVTLNAEL